MSNLCNLSSQDFYVEAANCLMQALEDPDYFDVTLVTNDLKKVRAHKMVLSSRSIFFKDIFKIISSNQSTIYLDNVNRMTV